VLAGRERRARVGEVPAVRGADDRARGPRVGQGLGVAAMGRETPERLGVPPRAVDVTAGEDEGYAETARGGGVALSDPPTSENDETTRVQTQLAARARLTLVP